MQYFFIVNSAIVNQCTGRVSVDNTPHTINDIDEAEAELLRIVRSIPMRDRVALMRYVYECEKKAKNAPTCKGEGKETVRYRFDSRQAVRRTAKSLRVNKVIGKKKKPSERN